MFMAFVALTLGILAFGSQAVLSFDQITFSSIEQCGSFSVSFKGGKPPKALPLSLTIVPFNSTASLSIQIPDSSWNDTAGTGAAVTFLPFAAGTAFVASLDDATGQATGNISDITLIQPSSNSSCLIKNLTNVSPDPYALTGPLAQCQPFNVVYNISMVNQAPSIRAFEPLGQAISLNLTSSYPPSPGMATYLMGIPRGQWLTLFMDDGAGNRWSTPLLTVQGDSTSSSQCLPVESMRHTTAAMASASSTALSKDSIIGIVFGAVGAVVILAAMMLIYVYRDCRRRPRRRTSQASAEEKGEPSDPPDQPPVSDIATTTPFVPIPGSPRIIRETYPYGPGLLSPKSYDLQHNRKSSSVLPVDLQREGQLPSTNGSMQMQPSRSKQPSIHSLDIEHILEMAAMYSQRASIQSSMTGNGLNSGTRGSLDIYSTSHRDGPQMSFPRPPSVPLPTVRTSTTPSSRPARPTIVTNPRKLLPLRDHSRDPPDVPMSAFMSTAFHTDDGTSTYTGFRHTESTSSVPRDSASSEYSPTLRSPTGNSPPLFTPYLGRVAEVDVPMPLASV